MLAAVPTGMSAAFREISTLTLPDSAVDAAIAPHNYTGNVSRICGGLMRARSEGQLRIVVLGTSMAAGAGLVGKERSWPKWLQEDAVKYSGGAFRNATVSFAPGGMSASFVLKLPTMREALHAAHLVIADYSLNDRPTHCLYVKNNKGHELEAAMGGQFMDGLMHVLRPSTGALFLELFPMGGFVHTITSDAQRDEYVGAPGSYLEWERPNETCVHGGREPSEEAAFERASRKTPRCPYDVARNFHWPELVTRAIPVLSYADGACRSDASPAVHTRALWDGEGRQWGYPHPSEATHRVVSQLVSKALAKHAERCATPEGMAPRAGAWGLMPVGRAHAGRAGHEPTAAMSARCLEPRTYLTAPDTRGSPVVASSAAAAAATAGTDTLAASFTPRHAGAAWRYYEDVPGKPGWIGTAHAPSHGGADDVHAASRNSAAAHAASGAAYEISFAVKTGALGMVAVEVLHSYAGMGRLRCGVNCERPGVTQCAAHLDIDARWEARESQGVLSTVAHEPARFARKEVLLQCSIRPTEPQPNALNAPKVKVLSVVGC